MTKSILALLPSTRAAVTKLVMKQGHTKTDVASAIDSLLWSGQIISINGTLKSK